MQPSPPVVRPAVREDLQPVVDLYCAYDEAVRGAPDTDPGDVLDDWDAPGFDLATGTRVVEREGRVVGYAVLIDGQGDSVVHPTLSGTDLPAELLAWLEEGAARAGTGVEHYVPDVDEAFTALMAGRGWVPARRFWRMRRDLDGPSPDPVWPAGVTVRDHRRPDDDRPVHELITAAFREIGGQSERTFEQWTAFLLDNDRFDPALCPLAVRDGQVVGAAMSQALGDFGFVRQLAVAPHERGRGVALALLHECFRRHHERGLPATVLGVDAANPTGALGLYDKAGMQAVEQFTRWERPAPD